MPAAGIALLAAGAALMMLVALTKTATAAESGVLEQRLLGEPRAALVAAADAEGDPVRGAIVFHQPYLLCTKCHSLGDAAKSLGPDLVKLGPEATTAAIVEAILEPSKTIRKGFEPWAVTTTDGRMLTGLLVEQNADGIALREATGDGRITRIPTSQIDERNPGRVSLMPVGLVNQLNSRQQFLDLVAYLRAIATGGARRAAELQPPPGSYAVAPLPEYEERLDHARLISGWNAESLRRGEAIYQRVCANCHGTHEMPGSLPTSLKFASGKFKNGSDPLSLYRTLTRGFGLMMPQTWMVPRQKYDVIHYLREAYLKSHNPTQFVAVDAAYLASLPRGDTLGPEPSKIEPWVAMDYGSFLVATYEFGDDASNFAHKGIAVRLDPGPGGVSRGRRWQVFDHGTLRMAGTWRAGGKPGESNFINWDGINFNGRHGVHPRVSGVVGVTNPTGPGWAHPVDDRWDDPRVQGRDGRRYGPLPSDWGKYQGLYQNGERVVVSYRIGSTEVLELPGYVETSTPIATRTLRVGPRSRTLQLAVGQLPDQTNAKVIPLTKTAANPIWFGPPASPSAPSVSSVPSVVAPSPTPSAPSAPAVAPFDVERSDEFDWTASDWTVTARIKTRAGGTIVCQTKPEPKWAPDGKTIFVRGGKLGFDIGWVGVVMGRKQLDDDAWHDIAVTWKQETGRVRLVVDGKVDAEGVLKPKSKVEGQVVRIGYTAADFPNPSRWKGGLTDVRFYQRALADGELAKLRENRELERDEKLLGRWNPDQATGGLVRDLSSRKHDARATIVAESTAGAAAIAAGSGPRLGGIAAAVAPATAPVEWRSEGGRLILKIAAGTEPIVFTVGMAGTAGRDTPADVAAALGELAVEDPATLTSGGPRRWPQTVTTNVVRGSDDGPLAVDLLTPPNNNPWFAQMRLTGFDFFPNAEGGAETDAAAVCEWDGNVWIVRGLSRGSTLTWQRIASGLFQPLGLKIVDGAIYVTCRDQLVRLRDLNGDGETDFYECFNDDHQVTEHFHEFAMGLQTDDKGNFYYAKSARHALTAVVPHHGTLLRVSRDGKKTDILATGFRAANGVCLNPDGSYIVTDQEGHWNPKNRINWVREGGFYGNMFGYHNVTDSSNEAMEQPLCWITNAFDRSPAELLWVSGDGWGPLKGSLLNLSYGYGKIYVVPHERVDGQMQGGMCELPLPSFPTGIMRGRFHPADGQLYTCGMFAWAGNATQPGGFYRVRYTGKPLHVVTALSARRQSLTLGFSGPLDRATAEDASRYQLKTWALLRSANYGSQHINEHPLKVESAKLSPDGKSVELRIPDLAPNWSMEVRYQLQSPTGAAVNGVLHNTVHKTP